MVINAEVSEAKNKEQIQGGERTARDGAAKTQADMDKKQNDGDHVAKTPGVNETGKSLQDAIVVEKEVIDI